jgi:group I intron endonuclease
VAFIFFHLLKAFVSLVIYNSEGKVLMEKVQKSYVYKITNNVNGKIYIGKANNPISRFKKHLRSAISGSIILPKLYNSIRFYGKDNFSMDILLECENEKIAYQKEAEIITELKTVRRGLNCTKGGIGRTGTRKNINSKLFKHRKRIIKLACEGSSAKEIAELFKVRVGVIRTIIRGEIFEDPKLKPLIDLARKNRKVKITKDFHKNNKNGRPTAKLSKENVFEIKKLIVERKLTHENIAKLFNISRISVSSIARGKTWTNIIVDEFISEIRQPILDEKKVIEIKKLLIENKLSYKEMGKIYGVSRHTIGKIASEKQWKNVLVDGFYSRVCTGGSQISSETIKNIKILLRDTELTHKEISEKCEVKKSTVRHISTGSWKNIKI